MTRTKSIRYSSANNESLLIQQWKEFFEKAKGKWKECFGNSNPIVLELACGRWEYTVWLSQIYPEKNFIGIDIKGERMMMGIKKRKEDVWENITNPNIRFLRTIIHHIDTFFDIWEVDEIWIVHPDPRPKWHDARRRITSPRFLKMYDTILKKWGLLKLKTDDDWLFEYSIEQLWLHQWFELVDTTRDLNESSLLKDHYGIETHYGKIFMAEWRTIKYGVWRKIS